MVETRGFLAAVEAADAMCKTAPVKLVRYEVVRDARVTVVVRGEVAEVESSVNAGGRAAGRVGELLATHVIPALEPEVSKLVDTSEAPRPSAARPRKRSR
jgi:ethanolamine utilization protein EutM